MSCLSDATTGPVPDGRHAFFKGRLRGVNMESSGLLAGASVRNRPFEKLRLARHPG